MRKIIVYLRGGLGNQMFQYSLGRVLARDNNCELVLDNWSGFIRDQYRRKYELHNFPIKARMIKPSERFPILIYRIKKRLFNQNENFQENIFNSIIINETENKFLSNISNIQFKQNIWLNGYWQSPLYFNHYENMLKKELRPPIPKSNKILKLGEQMKNNNSVAIGIRIYEESNDPSSHSKNRKIKSAEEINSVIERLKKKHQNAKFYLFCTYDSPFLKELDLPKNTISIFTNNEPKRHMDKIWLLSQCKHHIFNNSTFYWWGAWLSSINHKHSDQDIFASDNFLNENIVLNKWKKF